MRSRRLLHQLAGTLAAAALTITTTPAAGAQHATSTTPLSSSVTTAPSSAPTSTPEPTTAPPSQGTPPEQRRDRATPSPRFVTAGCEGFWNARLGRTFTVCGRILDKYKELGGPGGFLGAPSSNELTNPDGTGKRTSFEGNSTIYWHPDTDAHQIGGRIGDKWAEFGHEAGPLGYPITDELTNPDGGKRQAFQNDSSIYFKNEEIGAHQIGGDIGKRWGEMKWEASYLGYPITDELPTPNKVARFNHFEQGSIYWSGATGAHDVTRDMMMIWGAKGWEAGPMGLPTRNTQRYIDPTITRTLNDTTRQMSGEQTQRFVNAVAYLRGDGKAYVATRR